MPNIQTLVDIIRQKAFLEAGGGRKDPAESIGEIFGNVGGGMSKFSEARNKNLESILLGEKNLREEETLKLAQQEGSRKAEEFKLENEPFREPVSLAPGTQGPEERPLGLKQMKTLADIRETKAKAKYYEGGQIGGAKGYINLTTREYSEVPKPGFVPVSANTGASIATQPLKEQAIDVRQDDARNDMKDERTNRLILQYSNQMDNNYLLKEIQKQGLGIDTANQLDELAKQGNTVAGAALGMKQARGMGEVGVITENDVTRYITSGKLTQKAADVMRKWMTGAPTDATLDEIVQVNSVIKDALAEKIQPIYDRYVNRLSKNLNITKQEAAERLDVPYSGVETEVAKETPAETPKDLSGNLPATANARVVNAKGSEVTFGNGQVWKYDTKAKKSVRVK